MNVIWYSGVGFDSDASGELEVDVGTDDGETEAEVELYRFWVDEMGEEYRRVRAVGRW